MKPTQTIIVGGTAVVSTAIEKQLENPVRYGGFDRYKTAALVAQGMGANLNIMYLTTPVKKYLFGNAKQTKEVFILGGTAVVPDTILDQVGGFVFGDSVY